MAGDRKIRGQMKALPLVGGIRNSRFQIQDSLEGILLESLGLNRPV
jgi:hypothetical protein